MIVIDLVLLLCCNIFCTIGNLRIKCVTETKNVSVLFYKNLKSSFSTCMPWLTHLTLRFLYILGCSGPMCATLAQLYVFACASIVSLCLLGLIQFNVLANLNLWRVQYICWCRTSHTKEKEKVEGSGSIFCNICW